MSKEKSIELLMLLSALESWSFSVNAPIPDYLHENLSNKINELCKIILDQ